jgi:Na+-driven multidrug efflux pump
VASKVVSTALVMVRLCRTEDAAKVTLSNLRFDFSAFMRIFRFGIPASISSLVHPMGNLQITSAINSYGAEAIAGHSAAVSVENFVHAFVTGFGSSAMTFIGQNIGAKNKKRVRASLFLCLIIGVILSGSIGVFLYLTGRIWLGLILGAGATEAVEFGIIRMFSINLFIFIFAINNIATNSLHAYGYPIFSSISAIIFTLGFRTVWMQFIYPINPTFNVLMLCFTVTNVFNAVFCIVALSIIHSRYMRGIYRKI